MTHTCALVGRARWLCRISRPLFCSGLSPLSEPASYSFQHTASIRPQCGEVQREVAETTILSCWGNVAEVRIIVDQFV
jgi:hypothetical protein